MFSLHFRRSQKQVEQLRGLSAHKVAHFLSAYTYGNILILAALVGIAPEDVAHGHGAQLVLGTGFATLVAHVVAESQELMVLRDEEDDHQDFARSLKIAIEDSRPIFSATVFPALLLFLGEWHVLNAHVAWWASLAIIILRMMRNGIVIAKYRGGKVTPRTMILSIAFAAVCLAVAVLKVTLTH